VVETPDGFDELVASWNARTPPGTWVEVSARVRARGAGASSAETFVLGRWAERPETIHRTSVPGQASRLAHVDCDVLVAEPHTSLGAWQLTVRLHRQVGATTTPTVSLVAAMTSASARRAVAADAYAGTASAATDTRRAVSIAVPAYSQMLHRGQFPQYDNGGEAWCSPASTAMVAAYWKSGPEPREYAWVGDAYRDGQVAHAAAGTFDHAYEGAGNWSFNAAYAATLGLVASVTRLRSLAEAEAFLRAGIPLVASVSFRREELTGAGYDTRGHLLVITGFTSSGDVLVNDPASHLIASNDEVPVVYDRGELERAWLRGSGGIVYVIRPPDVPLPTPPPGTDPHW
jgi:hypothetical protein